MMQEYINQAHHNKKFVDLMESHFVDTFFDWKITVLFYCALHYLQAYAKHKNKRIGRSHKDFIYHSDPAHSDARNPLPIDVFEAYSNMFDASHNSRYNGFLDGKTFHTLMKINYSMCKSNLKTIENFIKREGLTVI